MGNVTVAIVRKTVEGNRPVRYADVTLSSSYATGGDSFTAAQFALRQIESIVIADYTPLTHDAQIDRANSKIKSITVAGVEVTAATNLTTHTVRVRVQGT